MNNFFKDLLKNTEGKISKTKLGVWLMVLSTAVLKNDLLSDKYDSILQIINYIGITLSGVGIRNALDKKPKD